MAAMARANSQTEVAKPKTNRSSVGACLAILFLVLLASASLFLGQDSLGRHAEMHSALHRQELRKALGLSLYPGVRPGSLGNARRDAVQTALVPLLATLPRFQHGRFAASAVRYAVHRYFHHKYGWNIVGFEPWRGNETVLSDALILKEKVPTYAEMVLKDKLMVTGFSEEDLVMLVAAVEQLIFDNVIDNVDSAYRINDYPFEEHISPRRMMKVLTSFMIEGILEGNFSNVTQHNSDRANIRAIYPPWGSVEHFLEDVVGADAHEAKFATSPFARGGKATYTFEDTARVATRVMEEFGPWSNYECGNLKEALVVMDPHKTGRVRLSDFYRSSLEGNWHFQESEEYLRQLGALDESSADLGPQVIITNYLTGMNNCILTTHYYSICCMNECQHIQQQIEAGLQKPTATVDEVATVVEGILGRKLNDTQQRKSTLQEALELVAANAHNNGQVPLHGRLFAQWLHFAFPHMCPYPHAAGTTAPETPGQIINRVGEDMLTVKHADLRAHIRKTVQPPSPYAGADMWSAREEHISPLVTDVNHTAWLQQCSSTVMIACIIFFASTICAVALKVAKWMRMLTSREPKVEEPDVITVTI